MFTIHFVIVFLILVPTNTMCPPKQIQRGFDVLDQELEQHEYLDEGLDSCDYVEMNNLITTEKGDLTFIQLNVRGITSKQMKVKELIDASLESNTPDIMLLCETWLNPFSPGLSIEGYETYRNDRIGKKGGGVAILASTHLRHQKIQTSTYNSFEAQFREVLINPTKKLICGSIYRPPNTDLEQFLVEYGEMLKEIKKRTENVVLGLDHNLDFLKSAVHKGTHSFIDLNLEHDLVPTITRPTCITKSSATLIDNILVSQKFCGRFESNILIDDIIDHLPTVLVLKDVYTNKKDKVQIKSRDMRPSAIDAVIRELYGVDWTEYTNSPNYDDNVSRIHQVVVETMDEFIPETTRSISYKKLRREPWITAGIVTSTKKAKLLYKQTLKKNCNDHCLDKYKRYNQLLTKVRRNAQQSHYLKMCENFRNNTSKLWRTINEISGTLRDKSNIIDHITINAIDYQPKQIANEFGKYFGNIGKKFANNIPKSLKNVSTYLEKIRHNSCSLFMNPCTTHEIKRLINSIPNKTSSGHDDISNKLLKEICESIFPALDYIVNESLKLGEFPTVMKLAEVVPLFKSGKSEIVGNYRLISLLMTISKVLEKVVYNQVYRFLVDTDQIYECQYGFRSQHSCEHAIGQLVGHVIKNLELKKDMISVFLDLSKAFDSLQHDIILKKWRDMDYVE